MVRVFGMQASCGAKSLHIKMDQALVYLVEMTAVLSSNRPSTAPIEAVKPMNDSRSRPWSLVTFLSEDKRSSIQSPATLQDVKRREALPAPAKRCA